MILDRKLRDPHLGRCAHGPPDTRGCGAPRDQRAADGVLVGGTRGWRRWGKEDELGRTGAGKLGFRRAERKRDREKEDDADSRTYGGLDRCTHTSPPPSLSRSLSLCPPPLPCPLKALEGGVLPGVVRRRPRALSVPLCPFPIHALRQCGLPPSVALTTWFLSVCLSPRVPTRRVG